MNKLIHPFILSKDRNNKTEFVKAIFEKEKENYNFTFDVHDNGENYLGRCCSNNHIDINYVYPFDLEYNFRGNRKSFEELLKNDIEDKQLYNHILLNKINEMKYIPKEGLEIVKQELIKLKQDIEFQKCINKDYSFLENEIKKYKEYKVK